MNLGFGTTNIITNEGSIFGSLGVVAALAVFDKLLEGMLKRFTQNKLFNFAYKKLHPMVYYSMILRPLIEAYLNAVIGSLTALYFLQI